MVSCTPGIESASWFSLVLTALPSASVARAPLTVTSSVVCEGWNTEDWLRAEVRPICRSALVSVWAPRLTVWSPWTVTLLRVKVS